MKTRKRISGGKSRTRSGKRNTYKRLIKGGNYKVTSTIDHEIEYTYDNKDNLIDIHITDKIYSMLDNTKLYFKKNKGFFSKEGYHVVKRKNTNGSLFVSSTVQRLGALRYRTGHHAMIDIKNYVERDVKKYVENYERELIQKEKTQEEKIEDKIEQLKRDLYGKYPRYVEGSELYSRVEEKLHNLRNEYRTLTGLNIE